MAARDFGSMPSAAFVALLNGGDEEARAYWDGEPSNVPCCPCGREAVKGFVEPVCDRCSD